MRVRSQRVTLRDVRTINETVYECRDLWADPSAWQSHLMRRVAALAGSRIGIYFEMADHAGRTADRTLAAHDTGWESADERLTVLSGIANQPLRYSPLWAAFADQLTDLTRGTDRGTARRAGVGLTARQHGVITPAAWQASEMYDRHVRPTRLGTVVLSAVWMPQPAAWSVWSLVADRGDPVQTLRHARLARLLHRQTAPIIGTRLSTWRDRTVDTLTLTRRRVLNALLDGQSEPDIARESCRSRSAVHEHVTALYRHFGVGSRGELAAFFLRRRPMPKANRPGHASADDWLDRPWAG